MARLAQERRWHPTQETTVLDAKGNKVEVRFEAGALEEVGTIYACRVNPDQDLARPGRRFLDFVQFKLLADDGFHRLHHRFGHLPDPAL